MKYLLLLNVLFVSSPTSYAINEEQIIKQSIEFIEPSAKHVSIITSSIIDCQRNQGISWKITAALLAHESRFDINPQNCSSKKRCKDYGIAQINYHTWGQKLSLDKEKLTHDIPYSIGNMCHILGTLKQKYGKEKKWYTRYHSFTSQHRQLYLQHIRKKYNRINAYSKFFEGKRFTAQEVSP